MKTLLSELYTAEYSMNTESSNKKQQINISHHTVPH